MDLKQEISDLSYKAPEQLSRIGWWEQWRKVAEAYRLECEETKQLREMLALVAVAIEPACPDTAKSIRKALDKDDE